MNSMLSLLPKSRTAASQMLRKTQSTRNLVHLRAKSTSPYGRSHLQDVPALPQPVAAHFPQLVVLTDGSTYTRYSTSPRSVIRLTRDMNNNPLWNPGSERQDEAEDERGWMGRFRRRFAGSIDKDVEEASA